jgi:hypothetical protein
MYVLIWLEFFRFLADLISQNSIETNDCRVSLKLVAWRSQENALARHARRVRMGCRVMPLQLMNQKLPMFKVMRFLVIFRDFSKKVLNMSWENTFLLQDSLYLYW